MGPSIARWGLFLALCATTACGGGGGSVPSAPGQPASAATSAPTSEVPQLSSPAATAISIPSAGGYSGTLTFPMSSIAFAQFITLRSATGPCPAGASPSVFCMTMTSTMNVTVPGFPSLTITLPPGAPAAGYSVGYYDPTQSSKGLQSLRNAQGLAGTISVSGNTLTVAGSSTALTLQANVAYVIVLTLATTASPTPTATASPSPAPTFGSVSAAPSTFSFNAIGQNATLSVVQPAYAGTFTATSADATIATVSTSDGKNFTVTAVAPGRTSLTLTGGGGKTASLTVTVTATVFGVN